MANIQCVPVENETDGRALLQWGPMAYGDTVSSLNRRGSAALAGSVQIATTGGAVSLQGSNDRVTWFDLKDVTGAVMTSTGSDYFEFSSSAAYLRPDPKTGVSAATVIICLRG